MIILILRKKINATYINTQPLLKVSKAVGGVEVSLYSCLDIRMQNEAIIFSRI
jgi:hypothetical protein